MDSLVRTCHEREHSTCWWVRHGWSSHTTASRHGSLTRSSAGLNRHRCWYSLFSSLSLLWDYFSPECQEVKQCKHHFQWLQYHLNTLPLVNASSPFKECLLQPTLGQPTLKFRGAEGNAVRWGKEWERSCNQNCRYPALGVQHPQIIYFHSGRKQTRRIKNIYILKSIIVTSVLI